jgi:hypothetical protein
MSEMPGQTWESDDCVRRTVVLPMALAARLAARAELRRLSVSDLLAEYAGEGLRRDEVRSGTRSERPGRRADHVQKAEAANDDGDGPAREGEPEGDDVRSHDPRISGQAD